MEGDERIDVLMIPVLASIKRNVKDKDAVTEIYNRAYEAVMNGMDVNVIEIQAYAKSVQDLIAEIMVACTYQDEPTAASGKYGLPKKCFDDMERLSKYTHGIYDGTYLDNEVSTKGGE